MTVYGRLDIKKAGFINDTIAISTQAAAFRIYPSSIVLLESGLPKLHTDIYLQDHLLFRVLLRGKEHSDIAFRGLGYPKLYERCSR